MTLRGIWHAAAQAYDLHKHTARACLARVFAVAGCLALAVTVTVATAAAASPTGPNAAGRKAGVAMPAGQQGSAGMAARLPRSAVIGGAQLAGRGVIVNYPARGALPLPRVPASAYVVADAGTGQVLAAKDPHGWYRPASTLKVLTAITLMPVLRPDQSEVATRWAASIEPSKVGLVAGQRYRVADLFRALLMISANDAAVALAQATGSYHRGIALMNAEARRLRAFDTVARTANGLDARGQHVSAYDEALFARQALRIPQFMADERLGRTRFPLRPHKKVTLWNQNTMLQTFPGDLGGKIGWTTPAEATFIGWARRHGHTLVVTILHATPLTEMHTAARLLGWGFAMDGKARPVGLLVNPVPVATRRATPPPRPRVAAARSGLPSAPIAAGAAAAVIAAAGAAGALLSRRARRAAARSAR